jgi:hypothetical protein
MATALRPDREPSAVERNLTEPAKAVNPTTAGWVRPAVCRTRVKGYR